MARDIDLSIREIDNLLQHLYLRLKGKKEGLSLAEPAAILLSVLKRDNPPFYEPQLTLFTPIIMDTLISRAYVSFGFEGLQSLDDIAEDISLLTGDYVPAGVEEGLSEVKEKISSVEAVLNGERSGSGSREEEPRGFFREYARGTAGIPLVSEYNRGDTPFSTSRVVQVLVEVRLTGEYSQRRKFEPVISFEHISAEPNSDFERQIHTAITAAEKFATESMKLGSILRVPREYRISLPEIAHCSSSAIQKLSGGSAGLAIAALLISVLSKLGLSRRTVEISAGTSLTGSVDENGRILTIEDSHIGDKVKAAFYSSYSSLVLPADNLETGRKELAELTRDHPSRRFDLLPMTDFSGLAGDRRIARERILPFGKTTLQKMYLLRKHLLATTSFAMALIISLFIVRPYYSRDIAAIELNGNRLAITNQFGRLITEHELDFTADARFKVYYTHFIGDFDGNGDNEAVCVISESKHLDPSTPNNNLHFIGFDNEGYLKNIYIYDPSELLENQMDEEGDHYPAAIHSDSRIHYDQDGKCSLIAIVNHGTRAPVAVINLDLDDFSNEIFLHRGFLTDMIIDDIDDDGTDDLIFTGYNIALKACVAVVLDSESMCGSSPRHFGYTAGVFENDIAKYYLKLPYFHRYIPHDKNDWLPLSPRLGNSPDGFVVRIHNKGNDVRFTLGKSMECVKVEILESFAQKEYTGLDSPNISARTGEAEDAPFYYKGKEEEEKDLKSHVRYWNGSRWALEPSINRTYLAQTGTEIDSTITRIDASGNNLVLKNDIGIAISVHEVGFPVPVHGAYRRAFFGDFLEEEGEEIAFAFFNSRELKRDNPERNRLFVIVFDEKGRPIRHHTYHENTILGTEIERASRKISMMMDESSSCFPESSGREFLYILTHHKTEPPASVIRLSLEDGSYETFYHKGILRRMSTRDVDRDGKAELILSGYNIMLDAPVIVALDPERIGGSSPHGASYNIPTMERDIAKYYIKLPNYHRFVRFNSEMYPLHIRFAENETYLKVLVESREEEVIFTIGDNMLFKSAEVVRKEHETDSLLSVKYPGVEKDMQNLLREVLYWDGEDWVKEPTENRSYSGYLKEGS